MKTQKVKEVCNNIMCTAILLVSSFLIWSVFLDMRAYGDPIAPATNAGASRINPARAASVRKTTPARSTVARPAQSRTTANTAAQSRTTVPNNRNVKTRSISVRNNDGVVRDVTAATRSVAARSNNNSTMRGISARNTGRVVARTATAPARVSLIGSALRASANSNSSTITNLTAKLYTGNYSNIIDSTTGLISADAYSNCLESYYTCMDEICTARSDAKGRCSCAGRATNFLEAETALEKANEELISLSGQLALLVSTKGKDVSEAFKLTDAEKVMNCVSYKDAKTVAGTTKDSKGNTITADAYMKSWCQSHMLYDTNECSNTVEPKYCRDGAGGNDFGFNIDKIDGSSSDILASLKAWANAKDLAKQYENSTTDLVSNYTLVSGVVNGLSGINENVDTSQAALDTLANKWGYELFQYAHNNVCGRVLDSCFNGIYEACGTPPTIRINNSTGGTTTATMCANSASSNCPFNYNSKIAVSSDGEVELSERGSTGTIASSTASCFGYTSTSGDPYASLRGPVADARRSIMQKYLLDANAACDTYGAALKNTAQNINYQKIAAEQALRQKRMDFYNEEESKITSEAITAYANFNECISEIWDCYNENVDEENWSTARIKTYCSQVANVPHCYEPMICKSPIAQFDAIIDVADKDQCNYSADRDGDNANTCRNVVTLQEILYGTGAGAVSINVALSPDSRAKSIDVRESCLLRALGCGANNDEDDASQGCLRGFNKSNYTSN